MYAGPDRVPTFAKGEAEDCRAALRELRKRLQNPGYAMRLMQMGIKEIILWSPEKGIELEMVFRDEVMTPRDRIVVGRGLVALAKVLNRSGGIDELVSRTGVRGMVFGDTEEVLEEGLDAGPLLCNHLATNIFPNADYSIEESGKIIYHS